MEQTEKEKQLLSNLNKCRCCFRMIIDERKAVEIDDNIRNQFFCLTQIELVAADIFASKICVMCNNDLMTFFELRKDLISKQNNLYELAGIDLIDQNIDDIQEEELEDEYELEMVDSMSSHKDFENEVVLEDTEEQNSCDYEDIVYDEEYINNDVLTIEKIERENVSLVNENDESEYHINYFVDCKADDVSLDDQSNDTLEVEMCELCDMEVLKGYLSQHIDTQHVEEVCSKCGKQFSSKILLKRHESEDHSANPKNRKSRKKLHYCPLCSKEYDYKKQLNDHIRSYHRKERDTECPVCKRKFYHRDLRKHIQHVHGEKKISCEICGKMYTCLENLRLHSKYHLEPKYTCQHEGCGKKFHQKTLWEHHMLKHKNEKSITCTECNSTFFTIRDLKRHNQRVHDKVSRKCFGCENTFCRKDKYREHVIKHHKELSEENKMKILEEIRNLKWNENMIPADNPK